jgi:integrase
MVGHSYDRKKSALFKGLLLANAGQDTRAIQLYLGHKNIQHTVRYTELASAASRTSGRNLRSANAERRVKRWHFSYAVGLIR